MNAEAVVYTAATPRRARQRPSGKGGSTRVAMTSVQYLHAVVIARALDARQRYSTPRQKSLRSSGGVARPRQSGSHLTDWMFRLHVYAKLDKLGANIVIQEQN